MLADAGVAAVFDDLHHAVRWSEGELRGHGPGISEAVWPFAAKEVVLDGRSLVLSPSVFGWPDICVATKPVTAGLLHYPARALATVWETRRPAPDALAALLGRTRAELLVQLAEPGTTGELAGRLGVRRRRGLAALRGAARGRAGRHAAGRPGGAAPADRARRGAAGLSRRIGGPVRWDIRLGPAVSQSGRNGRHSAGRTGTDRPKKGARCPWLSAGCATMEHRCADRP